MDKSDLTNVYIVYTLCILSINKVYMKTAVITLKIEPKIKKEAQKAAEEFGMSLSSLVSGF